MYKKISTYLEYDYLSGKVFWKKQKNTNMKVNQKAGTLTVDGYLRVGFDNKLYLVHRIAWLLYYKKWPLRFIDHINGNKLDNRITNLRLATLRENSKNQKMHRNGKLAGAEFFKNLKSKPWRSYIEVKNKKIHLGYFKTEQEAHAAYLAAVSKLETK